MPISRRDAAPEPTVTRFTKPDEVQPIAPASLRQTEIAVLLLHGLEYADIGKELGISPRTVEAHVSRLAERLPHDEDSANLEPKVRVIVWIHTRRRAA